MNLIDTLGLSPGPEFKEILAALDLAMIERAVTNREEALLWMEQYRKGSDLFQES